MPSADTIWRLGCGPLPRMSRADALATAGALLTCAAVVLGLGPFAKTNPPNVVAVAPAGASIASSWRDTASADVAAAAPDGGAVQLSWLASAAATPFLPLADAVAPEEHASPDAAFADPAVEAGNQRPGVVGVWSPDAGTCSPRSFRDGALPTVINAEGAWAGETFCIFTKRKETESGWRVVAKCSTPRARWTSNVRLTVSDNRLTWSSERGTQAYTRCASDLLMAQAR